MPTTSSKPFSRRVSAHLLLLRTLIVTAGACAAPLAGANEATTTETAAAGALEEIVVTATRREENISRVPISITAFSQDALNQKGIEDFGDIARFTPGVAFDTSQTNQIAIRGISSTCWPRIFPISRCTSGTTIDRPNWVVSFYLPRVVFE